MTEAEKKLWEHLRNHRFRGLHFRRQYPVGNRYILDFYCAKLHLGIEIDGPIHESSEAKENDAFRTEALAAKNIRILRFTNDQVTKNLNMVLAKIATAIEFPLST